MIVRSSTTMNHLPNIYQRGIVPGFQSTIQVPNFNWLIQIAPNVLTRKLNNILIDGIIGYIPNTDTLDFIIPAGIVCIKGIPVFTETTTHPLKPNTDTYVDFLSDGTPLLTSVPRGAAGTGVVPGSLRTQIVTTSSTSIITVRNLQITSINYLNPVINAAYSNINFTMRLNQQVLIPLTNVSSINIPVSIKQNQLYGITILLSTPAVTANLSIGGELLLLSSPTALSPYYSFVSIENDVVKTLYIETLKQPIVNYSTLSEATMNGETTLGEIMFDKQVSGFVLVSFISEKDPKFQPPIPVEFFFSDAGSANSLPL
jgi:hypothetical protein